MREILQMAFLALISTSSSMLTTQYCLSSQEWKGLTNKSHFEGKGLNKGTFQGVKYYQELVSFYNGGPNNLSIGNKCKKTRDLL
ncbi:MAG: hypothetical protein ACW98F_20110 [Candidatus Hodarchaeales archaeon]